MEPQIQYTRTEDGVSIGYTTVGSGLQILLCGNLPLSFQHVLDDTCPVKTALTLAAQTRLTTFDHVGVGASDRDTGDFSLAAQVRTIEAVAAQLADGPLTVVASGTGCASAALYATRHASRVTRLACVNPHAASMRPPAADENWSLLRRRVAGATFPEGPVSNQRWYGQAMHDAVTAEVLAAYWEEVARADLSEIYRRIPVPTLFCMQSADQRPAVLALARVVPDCRVVLGGRSDNPANALAILEFMGVDVAQPDASRAAADDTRGTAVILFADIVGSTALTEHMGDAAFRGRARALDASLRGIINGAGGTAIDGFLSGDGVLATFPAASQAIDAALLCAIAGEEQSLPLHLGLHAGDVIREQSNIFGGAVNIASRISGLSAPGEVLVSDIVRGLARTSAGVTFEDRGDHSLKGVGEPQRVYVVRKDRD